MTERELFEAALDREPDDRAAFLDRVCTGTPAIRERLEALLARQEQAGSFLEGAAADGVYTSDDRPNGLSQATEAVGQVLAGRYKLLEQIGEGGMGSVWLALQTEPVRRRVAVKLIKAGMDSRMVLSRFEAERQALALMDHPNIAKVLDGGTTEQGRPYFVMEYVKGVPITQYCDDAHLNIAERLELFVPVCQAVQHAHQKGVIHRDLKPSNLLICLYDDKPVPKVIDFGLAKAMHEPLTEHTLYTAHGLMLGTPLYMSPEQVAINNLDVDTRSDIYSLGVVLYELLTGTTPLEKEQLKKASWPEVLRLIQDTEPPKPSTRLRKDEGGRMKDESKNGATIHSSFRLHPSSFKELDWIVMKALDKDRGRRYETANGLARDIQRYLHDEPVEACPPSAWYRLRKLASRNRAILTTAALVSLALVLGMAVSVWQAFRATEANRATGRELQRTKEAEEKATRELFDSLVAQARANRLSRRIGQRFGTFEILGKAVALARQLHLPAERFLEMRNEALAAMALPDLRVAKEWPDTPGTEVCFDPKLERYARADLNGTVFVRRVGDGAEICRLPAPGPGENFLVFSPDCSLLAVTNAARARVQVWRLAGNETSEISKTSDVITGKEPAKVLDEAWRALGGCCFSPDSRQVAIRDSDLSAVVFDLATAKNVRRLTLDGGAERFAFNPKGGQLALISEGAIEVYDLQTGNVLWQRPFPKSNFGVIEWLGWHPDGKTLALAEPPMADGYDAISLWDITADKQVGKLEGIQGGGNQGAFNHAGTLLASTGWGGILRLWDPLTSRPLFSTFAPGGITPRFSRDDRFLAATEDGNKLRIWEIAAGEEYRTLTTNPLDGKRRYQACDMSADGRLLAAGSTGGVELWDWPSGKSLAFIEGSSEFHFVLFESSGAFLVMGKDGLFRRPFWREPATGLLHLGTPEKLPVTGVENEIGHSTDNRVLAFAQPRPRRRISGGVVLRADQPQRLIELGPHEDARFFAVSPNGEWVATGGYHYPGGAKVWDARTGKLEKDLPVGRFCQVVFSPNGKRLLTQAGGVTLSDGQIRVWETGTWAEVPLKEQLIGQASAFSPDGKLLVVETGAGVARLLDPNSGREYARLEDPNQDRASHFSFSPDGTKLVSATSDGHCLHVWDLRALRKKLAEMGLDWVSP